MCLIVTANIGSPLSETAYDRHWEISPLEKKKSGNALFISWFLGTNDEGASSSSDTMWGYKVEKDHEVHYQVGCLFPLIHSEKNVMG